MKNLSVTRNKRLLRNRSKIKRSNLKGLPRITVSISNKNTYCQLISIDGNVLASFSTCKIKEFKGSGIEKAKEVGKEFAKICVKNNYKNVVFDKGIKSYSGRVKNLADSCREFGLIF